MTLINFSVLDCESQHISGIRESGVKKRGYMDCVEGYKSYVAGYTGHVAGYKTYVAGYKAGVAGYIDYVVTTP